MLANILKNIYHNTQSLHLHHADITLTNADIYMFSETRLNKFDDAKY